MKLLYVCPFAHYTGHYAWAARHETEALERAGADVILLTFEGLIGFPALSVKQLNTRPYLGVRALFFNLARICRKSRYARWISMFLETYLTFSVAVSLKRELGADLVFVRDGEPFLFLLHWMNLTTRNYRWVVSLTGTNLVVATRPLSALKKDFRLFIYTMLLQIANSKSWKPVYQYSMRHNCFHYITQNDTIKTKFESYAGGVLAGCITSLPMGVEGSPQPIPREQARCHLSLPADMPVFLSFGFLHAGKDIDTVIRAITSIENVILLHGGDQGFRLSAAGSRLLAERHGVLERVIIHDYYIPEEEKPYYFYASDAVILSYKKDFSSTASLLWESCRFGIPVIASDCGQLGELVSLYKPGLTFEAGSASSLREAIIRFLAAKPEEIGEMKENCHRFSSDYSLQKWAEKILIISKEIKIRIR